MILCAFHYMDIYTVWISSTLWCSTPLLISALHLVENTPFVAVPSWSINPAKLTLSEKLTQLKRKMREDGSLDAMHGAGQNITHETLDAIARKARETQRCFSCQSCSAQFHFGGCKECEVISCNLSN